MTIVFWSKDSKMFNQETKCQKHVAIQISNVMMPQMLLMKSCHLSLSLHQSTWCEILLLILCWGAIGRLRHSKWLDASFTHVNTSNDFSGTNYRSYICNSRIWVYICFWGPMQNSEVCMCLPFNPTQASTKWCHSGLLYFFRKHSTLYAFPDTHISL